MDELPPREVGQMNFMPRLISERHHARQNQQSNQDPSKSSSHSHARLTAAVAGCQERTCAHVLKNSHVLYCQMNAVLQMFHVVPRLRSYSGAVTPDSSPAIENLTAIQSSYRGLRGVVAPSSRWPRCKRGPRFRNVWRPQPRIACVF